MTSLVIYLFTLEIYIPVVACIYYHLYMANNVQCKSNGAIYDREGMAIDVTYLKQQDICMRHGVFQDVSFLLPE